MERSKVMGGHGGGEAASTLAFLVQCALEPANSC